MYCTLIISWLTLNWWLACEAKCKTMCWQSPHKTWAYSKPWCHSTRYGQKPWTSMNYHGCSWTTMFDLELPWFWPCFGEFHPGFWYLPRSGRSFIYHGSSRSIMVVDMWLWSVSPGTSGRAIQLSAYQAIYPSISPRLKLNLGFKILLGHNHCSITIYNSISTLMAF